MKENLKNSRKRSKKQEKIDFMYTGEIQMDRIARRSALPANAFVAIDIKSTSLTMWNQDKSTAKLMGPPRSVNVKCLTIFLSVSILYHILTLFLF